MLVRCPRRRRGHADHRLALHRTPRRGRQQRGADAAEATTLEIVRNRDGRGGVVRLGPTRSSREPAVDVTDRSGTVPVDDDGVVELRVLVDTWSKVRLLRVQPRLAVLQHMLRTAN